MIQAWMALAAKSVVEFLTRRAVSATLARTAARRGRLRFSF